MDQYRSVVEENPQFKRSLGKMGRKPFNQENGSCNGEQDITGGNNGIMSVDHHAQSLGRHFPPPTMYSAVKPKEVAQVMVALNGHHAKNHLSGMDQPIGRDVSRPEHRSTHSHQHHHYQTIQQQPAGAGSMGGIVVDRDFLIESQIFRTPGSIPTYPLGPPNEPMLASPSQSDASGKTFGRKRSRKRPKTCGVCGDRAKSFHFGGLSCDSCKAFFRRSVQNDAHLAFRCAYDSCCDINISTRKSCQFCRFKKCLSIGMEKSWVMTEEERNALNQQRLEKKQTKPATTSAAPPPPQPADPDPTFTFQGTPSAIPAAAMAMEPAALAFQDSEYVADVDKMLDYMTFEEQLEIKSIVETYLHAYKEMPFRVSFEVGRRDTVEIIEMFTTILRRFVYFAKLIPDFAEVRRADQANLLRAAVLEMCLLRGAACFDTENNRWPSSTMESLKDCPQLRVEDMQRLVSKELFEMHISFIFHMKRLRIDEPIAMLLIMTVLFSPERMPVEDKVKINQSQEKYLMLLKNYVNWKFGVSAGSRVYPQLLTKLSDLRQLNDFHTEFHLNLDRQEVDAIKKSLSELSLNPYPNWNIVPESQQSSPEESGTTSPDMPAQSPVAAPPPPMSAPMMTQVLIQRFAERRISTLLENPYATFETDMGTIRQVQQTLGSLFPTSALSSYSQAPQQSHPSSDSESTRSVSQHDYGITATSSERSAPISPRGYSSSTESAEAQALEILQSSRSREYQVPPLRAPLTPSSHSSHGESLTLLPGEYHTDRLQQFFNQCGGSSSSGQEAEGVIRAHSSTSTIVSPRGSQSVLRKHSSGSGSSLPGTPSSVIRSAHTSRAAEHPTAGAPPPHHPDAQPFRSISCSTVSGGGWGGGEVHTTANGIRQPSSTTSVPGTTTARGQQPQFEEEPPFRRNQ